MPQQQEIDREKQAGSESHQVTGYILRPQLAHEEKRHAADTHQNRDEIALAKLLLVDKRLENQKVNRRAVLKKDRVGGGGLFRRHHKQYYQRRIENRGRGGKTV